MDNKIWINNGHDTQVIPVTLPNCWQGEADCVVGPFSSKKVANYFLLATVEYSQYDLIMESVFAKADAWYIAFA